MREEEQAGKPDGSIDRIVGRPLHERLVVEGDFAGQWLGDAVDCDPMPNGGRHHGLPDVVLDDDDGLRQGEDRRTCLWPEEVVHWRKDGSELAYGKEGLEKGGVVLAGPCDTVPARDAECVQAVCDTPDPLRQGRRR